VNWLQRAVVRRRDDESGMTLIELMIVILLLGILAAIVVLGIGTFQNTGDDVSCKTTAEQLEAAAAASYAKTGSYASWATYMKNGGSNKWSLTVDGSGNVDRTACGT